MEKQIQKHLALIGLPRSGTTWLAKGVDSHRDVYYLHEPDSQKKITIPIFINDGDVDLYLNEISFFLKEMNKRKEVRVVGKFPFFSKSYQTRLQMSWNQGLVAMVKAASRLSKVDSQQKVPIWKGAEAAPATLWKSIESPGRLNLLCKAAPDVKFVFIMRHPCGIASSVFAGVKDNRYSSSLPIYDNMAVFEELTKSDVAKELGITQADIAKMSKIQRLAARWLMYNEKIISEAKRLDNLMIINYEEFCSQPERMLKQLLDFYGLAWSPSNKTYLDKTTSSHSTGFYSIHKDPVVTAESWKEKLTRQQIDEVKSIVSNSRSGKIYFS